MNELQEIIRQIVEFRDARDWRQYHTPKNLAATLAIEVGELQETMLWKTDTQVTQLLKSPEEKKTIAGELADVLIYSLHFPLSAIVAC